MLERNEYINIIKKLNNKKNNLNKIIQNEGNVTKNFEKKLRIIDNNLRIKEYKLIQQELKKLKKIVNEEDIKAELNDIKKYIVVKFTLTIQEVEFFISLNNYLEHERVQLSFHEWFINNNTFQFLIEKMEKRTFTLWFVQSMKVKEINKKKITKIILFEYHKKYFYNTVEKLKKRKLESFVKIVYFSLIFIEHYSIKFKYYVCKDKFKEISKRFINSKILFLINSPWESTNNLTMLDFLFNFLNLQLRKDEK